LLCRGGRGGVLPEGDVRGRESLPVPARVVLGYLGSGLGYVERVCRSFAGRRLPGGRLHPVSLLDEPGFRDVSRSVLGAGWKRGRSAKIGQRLELGPVDSQVSRAQVWTVPNAEGTGYALRRCSDTQHLRLPSSFPGGRVYVG